MNIQEHTRPENLEKYAFYWSEARLLIAAVALFLGGIPPIMLVMPSLLTSRLLGLAWIVSGVVSAYLLYRWTKAGKTVFGGTDKKDAAAFFVNVVTGFNLGITGLVGTNIGMSITSNKLVFILAGLVYLAAAWHLWQRWNARGKRLF